MVVGQSAPVVTAARPQGEKHPRTSFWFCASNDSASLLSQRVNWFSGTLQARPSRGQGLPGPFVAERIGAQGLRRTISMARKLAALLGLVGLAWAGSRP